jgi:hypothetical protein
VITRLRATSEVATWGPENTSLFGGGRQPILSVNAVGGSTTPLTVMDDSRQKGSWPTDAVASPITIVLNWSAALKK